MPGSVNTRTSHITLQVRNWHTAADAHRNITRQLVWALSLERRVGVGSSAFVRKTTALKIILTPESESTRGRFGQCHGNPAKIPTDWVTMKSACYAETRRQIQIEVDASIKYLAIGAHFSRDTINRPGFAKLFFDAASEEREHATKLLDYLLMRGNLTDDVSTLIKITPPTKTAWESGVEALEYALVMESNVTNSIRRVIAVCEDAKQNEGFNDYHLVDYLTGDFLEEQYRGQRDLAGKASTLKKMMDRHSALGEFLFDKKLLGVETV